ncbi:TetR/AcrR family transcriptional regulator [Sphingorhabdus sp. Alg239-R122]|uniref:TetR/AcrR family transcriptional regulator n=1 Tax=Sphingorhabdus sp. Alg239-R122 TaxID=2305989 RepID=UPI001967DAB3|nr:TetR/AcrR family transcriptional regulator [Sphingorhabdus sp. Alg239-R122]
MRWDVNFHVSYYIVDKLDVYCQLCNMKHAQDLQKTIAVFTHYGYRKTSMDNIAQAVGISRQALYKKFESKEKIFHLAANALVEQSCSEALAAFTAPGQLLAQRLLNGFDKWSGQHVDLLRSSPHSTETVQMAGSEAGDATKDAEKAIMEKVTEQLLAEKAMQLDARQAENIATALYWASKGLMYYAENHAAYVREFKRTISALLRD